MEDIYDKYYMNHQLFGVTLPESIIKQYSVRIKASGGINFGQGIPSFPTAPHIVAAAKKGLKDPGIGVYPNFLGTLGLRTAIAAKLNTVHAVDIQPDKHILVTVGAMEATATAIFSLIQNGDRVGVITPDYCNHFPQLQLARADIVEIPMKEDQAWNIDLERVEEELRNGLKLLVLTNPNNPTGAVLSADSLQALVLLAQKYGTWVLSDETYSFLSYDQPFISLLDFWDTYDRLITVRSFSKEYAMTGWRVGYVVSRPEFIAIAAKTHDALTGCVPKVSQVAAQAAVEGSQRIVQQYVRILAERRRIVLRELSGFGEMLTITPPQGAYYVFPRVHTRIRSLELTERLLRDGNVAVVPGSVFGKSGEFHFRISFAVDNNVLETGMVILKQALTGILMT